MQKTIYDMLMMRWKGTRRLRMRQKELENMEKNMKEAIVQLNEYNSIERCVKMRKSGTLKRGGGYMAS